MEVSSTTLAPTKASNAERKLSGDFSTFLKLLTTQLQQQDPLDPLKSNEFTSQLVQFTSVEQSIQSNKNLETLIALLGQQSDIGLANYIGKQVTVENDSNIVKDKGASWIYNLNAATPNAKLIIKNDKGVKVHELPADGSKGMHTFTWDGKDGSGNMLPAGVYRLEVEATSANGTKIASKIYTCDIVQSIERTPTGSKLFVGGILVDPDQVISLSQIDPVV